MSVCGYLGWFLAALDVSMDCGKGNTRNQDKAGDGCSQFTPGSYRMSCFFLKLMLLADFLPFLIYINNRRGAFLFSCATIANEEESNRAIPKMIFFIVVLLQFDVYVLELVQFFYDVLDARMTVPFEIGRASCRERV